MRPEHWAREIREMIIRARGRGWGANEGATMLARAPRAHRRSGNIDGDDAIARRFDNLIEASRFGRGEIVE